MRKFKACYAKQYNDNSGQSKTSWKTIGYANEVTSSQDGRVVIHLSLDSIPTGVWDGEIKLFLQDEQQAYSQSSTQAQHQPQYQQQQQVGTVPIYKEII